jgi:hypothetical protein
MGLGEADGAAEASRARPAHGQATPGRAQHPTGRFVEWDTAWLIRQKLVEAPVQRPTATRPLRLLGLSSQARVRTYI